MCVNQKYKRHPDVTPLPITRTPDVPHEKLFIDVNSTGVEKYLPIMNHFPDWDKS